MAGVFCYPARFTSSRAVDCAGPVIPTLRNDDRPARLSSMSEWAQVGGQTLQLGAQISIADSEILGGTYPGCGLGGKRLDGAINNYVCRYATIVPGVL